jgi:hypothetical protein
MPQFEIKQEVPGAKLVLVAVGDIVFIDGQRLPVHEIKKDYATVQIPAGRWTRARVGCIPLSLPAEGSVSVKYAPRKGADEVSMTIYGQELEFMKAGIASNVSHQIAEAIKLDRNFALAFEIGQRLGLIGTVESIVPVVDGMSVRVRLKDGAEVAGVYSRRGITLADGRVLRPSSQGDPLPPALHSAGARFAGAYLDRIYYGDFTVFPA